MHNLPTYAKYKDGCKYHYYYTKGQEELHEAKKRHIALLVAIQKNDYAEMKKILKDR